MKKLWAKQNGKQNNLKNSHMREFWRSAEKFVLARIFTQCANFLALHEFSHCTNFHALCDFWHCLFFLIKINEKKHFFLFERQFF